MEFLSFLPLVSKCYLSLTIVFLQISQSDIINCAM